MSTVTTCDKSFKTQLTYAKGLYWVHDPLVSHADKILEHDARVFADFIYATRRAVSQAAKSLTLDFNPVMLPQGDVSRSKKYLGF